MNGNLDPSNHIIVVQLMVLNEVRIFPSDKTEGENSVRYGGGCIPTGHTFHQRLHSAVKLLGGERFRVSKEDGLDGY